MNKKHDKQWRLPHYVQNKMWKRTSATKAELTEYAENMHEKNKETEFELIEKWNTICEN